jgi:hypothetical protein
LADTSAQDQAGVPRTPWGDPDLQGIWTDETTTPFQRPARFANQEFFTEEQRAELDLQRSGLLGRDQRGEKGSEVDVAGAYNAEFNSVKRTGKRTSMVVDPPDGRVPVMKWAEDKRDYDLAHIPDAPEHETPWVRCITRGHPAGMFTAGYNNAYQIIQIPGYVVIAFEMIHETRIIPIDGRPRLNERIQHWNGEPRGRWEGNTLVVETTNYNSKGSIATSAATGRMRGIPQTDAMHVVERFTRVNADTMDYSVTITDPKVYARPWTVRLPLNRDDSYQMFEYSCHEGNYALPNALSFGRKRDREAGNSR